MRLNEHAGKPVPAGLLEDIPRLISAYFTEHPDPRDAGQRVAFGTSGHRGRSTAGSFNEDHILAIVQAVCDDRRRRGIDGPLFLGKDTHALSEAAQRTAVEVLAGNGVELRLAAADGYTPTPVISHAILGWNRAHPRALADGIVITPSHNPASDGGIKYNPPTGGPAETDATAAIQAAANRLLEEGLRGVRRLTYRQAMAASTTRQTDFVSAYVADLANVIDFEPIRAAGMRLGADALGGSGLAYWDAVAATHGLDITVLNANPDPTFRFMHVDGDGKVRMDCSSPHAMAGLVQLKDRFDLAWGNDPDFDRHGIVTPTEGLMNPNHYLAAAVHYLFGRRPRWRPEAGIGKTVVTSAIIDRVALELGRPLFEVPVGFKWFVEGLRAGTTAFAGEESAGASFLRRDGSVWTTDKDGIILALLAAEMTAVTDRDPAEHYHALTARLGTPVYRRIDAPATPAQKAVLKDLSPEQIGADRLAGEGIVGKLTRAPFGGAPIGGLKVVTENGWFAARPSGTEDVYKIYAESFLGEAHLQALIGEAQELVAETFSRMETA